MKRIIVGVMMLLAVAGCKPKEDTPIKPIFKPATTASISTYNRDTISAPTHHDDDADYVALSTATTVMMMTATQ